MIGQCPSVVLAPFLRGNLGLSPFPASFLFGPGFFCEHCLRSRVGWASLFEHRPKKRVERACCFWHRQKNRVGRASSFGHRQRNRAGRASCFGPRPRNRAGRASCFGCRPVPGRAGRPGVARLCFSFLWPANKFFKYTQDSRQVTLIL